MNKQKIPKTHTQKEYLEVMLQATKDNKKAMNSHFDEQIANIETSLKELNQHE